MLYIDKEDRLSSGRVESPWFGCCTSSSILGMYLRLSVEQFRPPVSLSRKCLLKVLEVVTGNSWPDQDGKIGITLELCAGIIDKEMSLEAAKAEVLEEMWI